MSYQIVKHCPTCGKAFFEFQFADGDRVRHMNGKEGVVDRVGDTVDVQFDGYRGSYDREWFKAYPNGLTKI